MSTRRPCEDTLARYVANFEMTADDYLEAVAGESSPIVERAIAARQVLERRRRVPERLPEHITDGTPCWCQPSVETTLDGDIIVHRTVDELP